MAKGNKAAAAAKAVGRAVAKPVDAALDVSKHAATGVVDLTLAKPTKVDMHAIGAAQSQESIAYRERLDNVSATAATADNVLNVATDPKKMLGLLMLIGLLVLVAYLLRNQLSSAFSWIGGIFSTAKAKSQAKKNAAKYGDDSTPDGSLMTYDEARQAADTIYSAFGWLDDQENVIYSQLGRVRGNQDWALLIEAWGPTRHFSRFFTGSKDYSLEGALAAFLSDAERQVCRNTLVSAGVNMKLNF